MSYEQLVEDHHKILFRDNVAMVAQQVTNHIMGAVTVIPASGEAVNAADLVGKVEASDIEEHSRTNPDNPAGKSRRWLVYPIGIESGELITKDVMFKHAMDSTSMLLRAHVAAVVRKQQDRILGVKAKVGGGWEMSGRGLFGQASGGKLPGTDLSDLPSGNFIPHNAAGGSTGLNTEKLRKATEAMELADFGFETEMAVYCAITPKQKTDLLNLALATKTQLNQFQLQQIESGKPTTLLGITWIFTNRLPTDANGYRLCPIWTKENVIVGEWQGINGRIWNDTSKRNLPQIMVDAYLDATRIEDIGVRVIRCEEAA
ncbi:phage capsid protein [Seohaeicola zhoushanensis]|uniref:Major capsid protein n=1 Tax=Seohaeicola zhoushanensis TaxID=1569283 RepID=A0A8J3GTJ7_9RHOB|nr:phage capsid protein [Seohaeicola zhoushanensis]GHF33289.1 hypothetical protein GCM10017056_00880 [Seohaeicola zhoushanensis]